MIKVIDEWICSEDCPEALTQQLEEKYKIFNGKIKEKEIKQLQRLIKEYPDVSDLYVILSIAYERAGKEVKCEKEDKKIISLFPNSFFGKVLQAQQLPLHEIERLPEFYGESLDLQAIYPNRDTFSVIEVMSFHLPIFRYYVKKEEFKKIDQFFYEFDGLLKGTSEYNNFKNLQKFYDHIMGLKKESQKVEKEINALDYIKDHTPDFLSYHYAYPTTEAPSFHHSEMKWLYKDSWSIESTKLPVIRNLPRESLIQDLEEVLKDSLRRFKYYKQQFGDNNWDWNTTSFPTHSLALLGELKAYESLPLILEMLRQGNDFLEFYFEDMFEEVFEWVLYQLGEQNLDELLDFIKEENIYTDSKGLTATAVAQIAVRQPQRREEVIKWFNNVLTFFYENKDVPEQYDMILFGHLLDDVTLMRGVEIKESLIPFFKEGLTNAYIGSWEESWKKIQETELNEEHLWCTSIDEFYQVWEDLCPFDEEEKIDSNSYTRRSDRSVLAPITPIHVEKINRNSPCPCGSGKKYKQCCGK